MPMRATSQTLQNHTTMDRDRRWRSSMVEQLICNQQVAGSSPIASSVVSAVGVYIASSATRLAARSSSREGLGTLSGFPKTIGRVPERSKGTDCKSVATGFEGSNPSPSTIGVAIDHAGVAQLVELQPSKLDVAGSRPVSRSKGKESPAHLAQLAEHVLGKDEVTRSIRVVGSRPRTADRVEPQRAWPDGVHRGRSGTLRGFQVS
jgi:hypothetical protein